MMANVKSEKSVDHVRAEENALINFQFAVIDALNELGLSHVEFAGLLGVSRARVSQLLSSEANPTLKLVGRALFVLGLEGSYQAIGTPKVSRTAAAEYEFDFESAILNELAARSAAAEVTWGSDLGFEANDNRAEECMVA